MPAGEWADTSAGTVTEIGAFLDTQAWLTPIIDSSFDAVIGTSTHGTIVVWNLSAAALYRYESSEVLGKPIDMLCPSGDRSRENDVLAMITRGERVLPYETVRVRKDGSPVPVLLSHCAVVDPSGEIVGVVTVHRDDTDRHRARSMFRGVLEAAPDATVCVGGDGRIEFVNDKAVRLFRYEHDELVGAPVEMLVPDEHRVGHSRHRATYFESPSARLMGEGRQLWARRADGTEFAADVSLSGTFATDRGMLVSAAIRDASAWIEAEEERSRLRAAAAEERFDGQMHRSRRLESLGQLAGGVAHDFNNLLGIILNYTAFAAEEVAKAVAEETAAGADPRWRLVADDLDEAYRAAERGALITRQLLAVGGRDVVHPEVVDLGDVVRGVEQLLRTAVGEDVEVRIALAPDLGDVMADPGQLEQVLVNLALNARDAMPGGGTLTIDTENVVIDEAHASQRREGSVGPHVRLRVSDTGIGMERTIVERAFEPFFTTKSAGVGTGLGLATVYGIVNQAGGDIQIYSEPGFGTTVSVLLPLTDVSAEQVGIEEEVEEESKDTKGVTVLVVEDEDAMRALTVRILTRHGYRVMSARCSADAIAAASAHQGEIDLLVTDVVMPHMLGNEMAEQITAADPDVRVIFMSGYAQSVLSARGTLERGVALISKPFTEAALLVKIRAVLGD